MSRRAARGVITAWLILAGAGGMVSTPLGAQALGNHNGNAPVNFAADRIEVQDRADRVVLTGNVDITQDNLRLRAARVTVAYTSGAKLQVQRMIAAGGVIVTRPGQTARGDAAVYDLNQRIITMAGNVALTRQSDTLTGGRLTLNLATGISNVDGHASSPASGGVTGKGGRVSGQFAAPQQH